MKSHNVLMKIVISRIDCRLKTNPIPVGNSFAPLKKSGIIYIAAKTDGRDCIDPRAIVRAGKTGPASRKMHCAWRMETGNDRVKPKTETAN
ncbi:hypothetical protein ABEB36_004023 [Hypothenemus hampei]|uniref:Uncharacterized protein n=1 Tax=Hypothenemus hampei TaxID=57062 RepID=A0ABD1F3A5_HYPHA